MAIEKRVCSTAVRRLSTAVNCGRRAGGVFYDVCIELPLEPNESIKTKCSITITTEVVKY